MAFRHACCDVVGLAIAVAAGDDAISQPNDVAQIVMLIHEFHDDLCAEYALTVAIPYLS